MKWSKIKHENLLLVLIYVCSCFLPTYLIRHLYRLFYFCIDFSYFSKTFPTFPHFWHLLLHITSCISFLTSCNFTLLHISSCTLIRSLSVSFTYFISFHSNTWILVLTSWILASKNFTENFSLKKFRGWNGLSSVNCNGRFVEINTELGNYILARRLI